jgi:hypothetical protein
LVPAFNGPIYEGIFTNISSLFSSPDFSIMIAHTQLAWFQKSIPCRFPSPSPGVCLEKVAYSGYQSSLCQSIPTQPNPKFDTDKHNIY